jgi:hypothetical protein
MQHRRKASAKATTLLNATADQDGKFRFRPLDFPEVGITHQLTVLLQQKWSIAGGTHLMKPLHDIVGAGILRVRHHGRVMAVVVEGRQQRGSGQDLAQRRLNSSQPTVRPGTGDGPACFGGHMAQ